MTTPPARAVELTVAKNRHGDTRKVGLIFRLDLGTMREEAKASRHSPGAMVLVVVFHVHPLRLLFYERTELLEHRIA